MKHTILIGIILTSVIATQSTYGKDLPLNKIQLPPGFKISIYADEVPNARAMTWGEKGTLFVGSREKGNVYAIVDDPKEGKRKIYTIAKGLNLPAGVAFKDGALYVSAVDRILRYDNIEAQLNKPPKPVIVSTGFPDDTHHGWKFIAFGPDGKLYVPVGAPCNVCLKEDPRFASMMRMNADGSELEIYAQGIRNTVGFDWDPQTKVLWFTDNGADYMGENSPPDELNTAPKKGAHFGYPYCHGKNIQHAEFNQKKCSELTPSTIDLDPHVAALGMRFYTGKQFPEAYHDKIFIAEHGSWNREIPIGYRVTVADPKTKSIHVFAQGWLQGEKAWGRPADVLVAPDGSLLVSDDKAGVIYRINFSKEA